MATALSDDIKQAKRLLKLTTQIKGLEKEADALKAGFKNKAGGKDLTVEGGGVKLTVDHTTQQRVDLDELRTVLGAGIEKYQRDMPVVKVSVKKIAKGAA